MDDANSLDATTRRPINTTLMLTFDQNRKIIRAAENLARAYAHAAVAARSADTTMRHRARKQREAARVRFQALVDECSVAKIAPPLEKP